MLFRRIASYTLGVIATAHAAWAEDPPTFLLKWGSFCDSRPGPPCTGLFNEPFDLAIGPNGDVYVSDTVNQRIQQFTPIGGFVRTWGSFCNIANGQGCVDPDMGGPLQLGDGEFWDPVGLTFNAAGNLHVAEWSNDRVQVFDATGSFIRKWGSSGSGPGQFDIADDVAFDSQGRVFVVDKLNNRIQRFSSIGAFQLQWGSPGSGNGQFNKPVGIAIDAADNVFVAEQYGHRIQKFTVDGAFVHKWGTFGAAQGQFNEPIHIAVDAAGNVYVPDSKNHRIQKFDGNGTFLTMWGSCCNIATGQGCVDPDMGGPLQLGDGQFLEPEGVTVDALGDIYVVDTRNHRVQKFRPGGVTSATCDCPPAPPADRAAFKVGVPRPVPGNPDQMEVPLLVNTSESATFTQMTIEYDSNCMTYVSTAIGADVGTPGGIADLDELGAVDPNADRNLTINASGTYTGCDQEVFIVTFELAPGAGPCELVWDPTPGGANSNNHVNYTGTDGRIFPPDIAFCDGQVDRAPCPACDPMALPDADTAVFKVGDVQVVLNQLIVPLLVDTREDATFTQMTIEYNSGCMTYNSAAIGADVGTPGGLLDVDEAGAVDPSSNRNVTLNASGTYTGCDQEVFVLTFDLAATPPCFLEWDATPGGPNSNNHVNYDNSSGGDGKIIPPDIAFCTNAPAACSNSNVEITGTVEYFSNHTPIIATRPDPGSLAVTVEDPNDQNPSTSATGSMAVYSLAFGAGPQTIEIEAHRPLGTCGLNEDGVVGGDDVILLQNSIAPPPGVTNPRLKIAGDVNRDGLVNATDVIGIKRWIARTVCNGTDDCDQMVGRNCSGTWRFIFLTGAGPDGFEADVASLGSTCDDRTVDIEGILVGDFDGSWPAFFPKAASPVELSFDVKSARGDDVDVALHAKLDAGESLRHVIYSLTYDADEFEFVAPQLGAKTSGWEILDNPAVPGVTHGIVHMPPHAQALRESGEIVVFRFRARKPNAVSRLAFTRSKANDLETAAPALVISNGDPGESQAAPVRYSLRSQPNPFNPSTRILFTIPAGVSDVPVKLHVYDIAGKLVRTLVQAPFGPGEHQVPWDGKSDAGRPTGAGIYVVRIQAGAWSAMQKIALVK
jgi:hypothetical protein